MWTSGNRDPGKLFMWDSTGQTLGSYFNWAEGEPEIVAVLNETQPNCLVLNSTDQFKWYDHGCKTAEHRYICELKSKLFIFLAVELRNTFFIWFAASHDDEYTRFTYGDSTYEVSGIYVSCVDMLHE